MLAAPVAIVLAKDAVPGTRRMPELCGAAPMLRSVFGVSFAERRRMIPTISRMALQDFRIYDLLNVTSGARSIAAGDGAGRAGPDEPARGMIRQGRRESC